MKKFIWIVTATGISACTAFFTDPISGIGFAFGVFAGGCSLAVFEWLDASLFF